MPKSLLTLLIIVSACGTIAEAKTMKLPSDKSPVATIDIPDEWQIHETRGGFTGVNEDRDIYFIFFGLVDPFPMANVELDDTFTMLKDWGIVLDQSSRRKYNFRINGLFADETTFTAKEKGHDPGPRKVSITRIGIKNDVIVLTHFGSPKAEEKHREEMKKIVRSLKPVL